jgi:hypothetical protein
MHIGEWKMAKKRRKWTDEDIQFLRDNHQKMTNKELGEHFNAWC